VTLRRFAAPPPAAAKPGITLPGGIRPAVVEGERCEMCGERIGEEHGHVVNLEDRQILCTCRACTLLFAHEGAAQGVRPDAPPGTKAPVQRYRKIPERYLYAPSFEMSDVDWEDLQIPVGMAFFFRNSSLGRTVAFYPSPAGATESELPIDAWVRVLAANPSVAIVEPDVEALLIDRKSGAYLVPIDVCYTLVGLVRTYWKGFDGGSEVNEQLAEFFNGLRERSEVVRDG
jgi:Family of unknown function (DUF5947)